VFASGGKFVSECGHIGLPDDCTVAFVICEYCIIISTCRSSSSSSRPTQPPTHWGDGKWVVAYKLHGEGPLWLIVVVVCLLASNHGSNCSLRWVMDGRMLRCGIISSRQSAATSEIVKRFWVL